MCTGKREREQHQPVQAIPASTTSETERIRDQPDPRNSCPDILDQGAIQDIAGLFKDQAGYEEQVSEEGSLPGLTRKSKEDSTAYEDSQDDSGDEGYSDWKKSTNNTWVPTRKRNNRLEGEDSSTDSEDKDEERHASGRGGHTDRMDSPGQVLMRRLANRLEKSRAARQTLGARPRPEPIYTSSEYNSKEDWTCEDTCTDDPDHQRRQKISAEDDLVKPDGRQTRTRPTPPCDREHEASNPAPPAQTRLSKPLSEDRTTLISFMLYFICLLYVTE